MEHAIICIHSWKARIGSLFGRNPEPSSDSRSQPAFMGTESYSQAVHESRLAVLSV